jgi:hypothetical protein
MIPDNPITETQDSQESSPKCERGDCTQLATRTVTIETTQFQSPITLYGVTFATIINHLVFPSRRITVDLCSGCYHFHIKHDKTLQIISVVGTGPYEDLTGGATC